ncbi:glycine cleavage system protein H [Thermodesulforhabdus norvegica]|uniref:Glycine cleavage system H protein (Lipoate-binding) n=1 Tax=Thermodesulforhabdus norvegica TaxID=39841 RepID=A0A1I4SJ69_9BACT|nr:glycine cleavage system protein H [Thermodesulforhabdus norvegica]SFM64401.1 Glycine cleavage system H protein (lipoate-binding) [Thermodesulforhabdus norvegica]
MAGRTKKRKVVFGIKEEQCVWMKAGVVNFKICHNGYDCTTCAFDRAMREAISRNSHGRTWREELLRKAHGEKFCRYMLTGDVPLRNCANAYDCARCEFDQLMEAYHTSSFFDPVAKVNVSGFILAADYYYHPCHTWARCEYGGLMRVGMDDFAWKLLGFLTEIRLPEIGSRIGDRFPGWTARREEKIAPLAAPVKGVVVARNYRALEMPDEAKRDPYGEGWLLMIEPENSTKSLDRLLDFDRATGWMAGEVRVLDELVADTYGMSLAATGGERVEDIYGNLKQIGWDRLVETFLIKQS